MSLVLHAHPLSSYCHKVLTALYELDAPFELAFLNLGDEAQRNAGPAQTGPEGPGRGESNGLYTSDAQPYPLVLVPRWLWRLGAIVALAAIAAAGRFHLR